VGGAAGAGAPRRPLELFSEARHAVEEVVSGSFSSGGLGKIAERQEAPDGFTAEETS